MRNRTAAVLLAQKALEESATGELLKLHSSHKADLEKINTQKLPSVQATPSQVLTSICWLRAAAEHESSALRMD